MLLCRFLGHVLTFHPAFGAWFVTGPSDASLAAYNSLSDACLAIALGRS